MSLVPILYTSLMLFGILMVVIVSVSYIAYKIRNRNGEEEEEYREFTPQKRYLQQQAEPVRAKIKVVPTIKRPELKKTSALPIRNPRTTVINDSSSHTIDRKTSYQDSYSNSKTYEPSSYSTRTNSGSYKSRLEIVNRFRPEEEPKEKFVVSGSGSIALPKYYENFKAIQYYSDDEEEYFYKPSGHFS